MQKVTIDQELKNEIKKFWKSMKEGRDLNYFLDYLTKRDIYLYVDYNNYKVIEKFEYEGFNSRTKTYYRSLASLEPEAKTLEMIEVIKLRGEN